MDGLELIEALRGLLDREQELYRSYLLLVEKTDDMELKEIFGHHAYEEFTHLNTLVDRYKELVDEMQRRETA